MLLQEYGIRPWELERMDERFVTEFLARHEEKIIHRQSQQKASKGSDSSPSPGRPGEVTEIAQIGNWNVDKSGSS